MVLVRVAMSVLSIVLFTTSAFAQSGTDPAGASGQPATAAAPPAISDRYRDGMVIWETPAETSVPFLLKFNINTQLRYLNTLDSDETFTDHLGMSREVHKRNDITVNRAMFILGGFIFDPRLRYSFTVWTSAGAASKVERACGKRAVLPALAGQLPSRRTAAARLNIRSRL